MGAEPRTARLDWLWDALWADLRHNATGKPSGEVIIAAHRPVIEAEAVAAYLAELAEKVRAEDARTTTVTGAARGPLLQARHDAFQRVLALIEEPARAGLGQQLVTKGGPLPRELERQIEAGE
jgi:hypothetical protein